MTPPCVGSHHGNFPPGTNLSHFQISLDGANLEANLDGFPPGPPSLFPMEEHRYEGEGPLDFADPNYSTVVPGIQRPGHSVHTTVGPNFVDSNYSTVVPNSAYFHFGSSPPTHDDSIASSLRQMEASMEVPTQT